ncbi:Trimethyltridecatetraene synthase [Camellia lanceoleosa]|uniref:Trimethyltridecatetraene synthase n=1 Tax=Camellia lanceoleosa TaxID=1840588 RepID=A0ACC0FF56_9ERIC|nr:Trimethyltridecatetraene synthase [Camellia lanceoleosa]
MSPSKTPPLQIILSCQPCISGNPKNPITGGTDTSSVTVEWAISKLVKQPQFLRKATEELDRVIARDRWVEEKDIPQLPYINLIAKETMRLHHVATLLAPHYSIEDCNVAGYDIPKGTTVFLNTWGIARDLNLWVELKCLTRKVQERDRCKGTTF